MSELNSRLTPLSSHIQLKSGAPASGESQVRVFELNVPAKMPETIERLLQLCAKNIAWSWDQKFLNHLEAFDPLLWQESDANPVNFFHSLRSERIEDFLSWEESAKVIEEATSRLEALESFENPHSIAYFCMEYGLTQSLRLYSGGLGVLAGDHLKTASDLQWPLCAVGLAYQYGYFTQRLDENGQQHADEPVNKFDSLPLEAVNLPSGERLKIEVPYPGRKVWAQAWTVKVGRVSLYLLDTNIEENSEADRALSDKLYGGDNDHRLNQEILLGIGGYWLLKAMGRAPDVYHMNEGHAAFLSWARLTDLVKNQGLSFEEARTFMEHSSVFTTHTPVPAGHDVFGDKELLQYAELYAAESGVAVETLMGMGKLAQHNKDNGCFSMTDLALSVSGRINGVSQVHGRVSREMFHEIYPQFPVEDVPVKGITNGVHTSTWLSQEWNEVFEAAVPGWAEKLSEETVEKLSDAIDELPDYEFWERKQTLKARLMSQLRAHVTRTYERRGESPAAMGAALAHLTEDAFVIGFARRFATYKRATLLFQHVEKLEQMIDDGVPIVIVYAGKAHPKDIPGQTFIKEVIEMSRRPKLRGRVVFVENYEMDIARHLVQGVDVWLNTPTRPLEASGTSGMKASINGTLNLSVDDGWWSEAYNGMNGWLIADRALSEDMDFQLEYDSAQIYGLLENEVLPSFFSFDEEGISYDWIERMKESMKSTLWNFSTARMLGDYKSLFLDSALESSQAISKDSFGGVKQLAEQKSRFDQDWGKVSFKKSQARLVASGEVEISAELDLGGFAPTALLVEACVKGADKTLSLFELNSADGKSWTASLKGLPTGPSELSLRARPVYQVADSRSASVEHCVWSS